MDSADASATHALAARRMVARACRVLANAGLAEDILGHVSVRTGAGSLLVRCRGPHEEGLLFTSADDVREVDFDGHGDLQGWAVPHELPIHAEVLRARPDVDAVVHCHPLAVLVAGLADVGLRPAFGAYNIPALRMAREGVPVWPRSVLVRCRELGEQMVAAMGGSPVLLLRGHGITTTGSGEHAIEQAVVRALNLDVLARVSLSLHAAGGRAPELPREDLDELPDLGSDFNDLFAWRHQLARLRHAGLDLPGTR